MLRKWTFPAIVVAACMVHISVGQGPPADQDQTDSANDPALVGWWKMDESTGDTAADAGPFGYHGKLKGGPTWTSGVKGNALKYDGVDDYVAITRAYYGRAGHDAVTVAAWIRTSSEKDQVIFSFDRNEYWRLEVNGTLAENGQVGWSVFSDAGQVDLASRATVADGRWHHVAGVFDNGRVMIYIDGIPDAATTSGRTFGTGNRRFGFLGVGSEADTYDGLKGPENYFAGHMDDVRLYTRALSRTEIEQIALSGTGNDACRYATPIGEVQNLPFDTGQATPDGPGLCIRSPNLWYRYTPSVAGVATVSLCGSQYDTMVAVYRGAECDPGRDRLIGCNDDFCGLQSQLTFDVVTNQEYLIEVGGFDRRTGQGVLTISVEGITPAEFDLGDAPDGSNAHGTRMTAYANTGAGVIQAHFPTVFDNREGRPAGPLHLHPLLAAHLGESVSLEIEADKGTDEDGVNNIHPVADEANQDGADDGVLLPIEMPHGDWASFEYVVNVVEPGTDLWVNVWLDWNRDGDWDDDSVTDPRMVAGGRHVSEWVVQNQYLFDLPAGLHQLRTPAFLAWHPDKGPQDIWMRITLAEQPWKGGASPGTVGNGGSGPAEGYEIGETEDYLITPESVCSLCQDYNGDGKMSFDDLISLIYKWLDCCSQ